MIVKVKIGSRQKIGLRAKLSSKTEAFLVKIRMAVRAGGREAKMPLSSFKTAISSERRLAKLAGVAKPNVSPLPNKKIAMKIHLL